MLDYFEDTWIGRLQNRSRRRTPKFPREWWNCYESVIQGMPKANNAVEGWHRGFETTLRSLNALLKQQTLMLAARAYEDVISCEPPRKKKYKDAASRLLAVVRSYRDENMDDERLCLDYLRGVAHNIDH